MARKTSIKVGDIADQAIEQYGGIRFTSKLSEWADTGSIMHRYGISELIINAFNKGIDVSKYIDSHKLFIDSDGKEDSEPFSVEINFDNVEIKKQLIK